MRLLSLTYKRSPDTGEVIATGIYKVDDHRLMVTMRHVEGADEEAIKSVMLAEAQERAKDDLQKMF